MEDDHIGLKESSVLDVRAPAWRNSAVRVDSEVEIQLIFIQLILICVTTFFKTLCEETLHRCED